MHTPPLTYTLLTQQVEFSQESRVMGEFASRPSQYNTGVPMRIIQFGADDREEDRVFADYSAMSISFAQ